MPMAQAFQAILYRIPPPPPRKKIARISLMFLSPSGGEEHERRSLVQRTAAEIVMNDIVLM